MHRFINLLYFCILSKKMFDDYSKKDVLWSQSYLSLQNVTTPHKKHKQKNSARLGR